MEKLIWIEKNKFTVPLYKRKKGQQSEDEWLVYYRSSRSIVRELDGKWGKRSLVMQNPIWRH